MKPKEQVDSVPLKKSREFCKNKNSECEYEHHRSHGISSDS